MFVQTPPGIWVLGGVDVCVNHTRHHKLSKKRSIGYCSIISYCSIITNIVLSVAHPGPSQHWGTGRRGCGCHHHKLPEKRNRSTEGCSSRPFPALGYWEAWMWVSTIPCITNCLKSELEVPRDVRPDPSTHWGTGTRGCGF